MSRKMPDGYERLHDDETKALREALSRVLRNIQEESAALPSDDMRGRFVSSIVGTFVLRVHEFGGTMAVLHLLERAMEVAKIGGRIDLRPGQN